MKNIMKYIMKKLNEIYVFVSSRYVFIGITMSIPSCFFLLELACSKFINVGDSIC